MRSYHLLSELKKDLGSVDRFPALSNGRVGRFHYVRGGYDGSDRVVELVHRVQGPGSPTDFSGSKEVEIHSPERAFYIESNLTTTSGDYPKENHVLRMLVDSYVIEPYAFRKELNEDVDKRETEFYL